MKFGAFQLVNILWLLPALTGFYFWAHKKRTKAMQEFADKKLLNELTLSLHKKRQYLRAFLILVSILMIIISLMRPQWGFSMEKVKRSGIDILIAVDTSKSMLAEDIKPNRLERSKLAIKDLVEKLRGDRIGLIAFSGSAFLQCPLTVDYNGFLLSLNELDFNTIPKGGTSISSAIKAAINSYEGRQKKYKILVIITDGEDHEGNAVEMAEKAKEAGVKIFSIGIGTKEGELIPVTDESGNKIFLKDRRGNVVKTRLDETTLQKIALTTGGSYVRATNTEFGLDLIYKEKLSKMEKREMEDKIIKRYEERFQIPLAIALFLLVLELFISDRKRL
ncbi:MAG TPA: VWA domain-containing protein [Nitrospirae bacterium]|nr:VWA domain-containing protein [Nitrospirota bacterium]